MTTMIELSELRAFDKSDMLGGVSTLPSQLRDGLARARSVEQAILDAWPGEDGAAPRALVVCGMGGSGVGADLIPAAAEHLGAPVIAVKGYELPSWVTDEDRVICCSYSGMTSETISCLNQAIERTVVAAVITTGGDVAAIARDNQIPVVELQAGFQPRAAVGMLFGALAGVCEMLNVVDNAEQLVEHAADGAQSVIDAHTGTGPESASDEPPALAFARELHDGVVVVYGAQHTEAIAQRWKAQINENTKMPCWANAYPELDHNEIVGWEFAKSSGGKFGVVELIPFDVSDAVQARFDITKRIIEGSLSTILRFEPSSNNRAGATFELLVWGDYISIFGAMLRGIDPTPVDRIHVLKGELAGR